MRFAFLALLVAAKPAAAKELARDLRITGEVNFAVGGLDVGFVDGFAAPVGHFNLGIAFRDFRVQSEADIGLWSTDEAPEDRAMSGAYKRLGWAARYYWMDLAPKGKNHHLRLYVEGGFGKQWISAKGTFNGASLDVDRTDVAFGFGMAQEARLGPTLIGGHFGVRAQVAGAPEPFALYTACRGSCDTVPSYRPYDVAVFVVFGMVVGR
jgi:hypothetical protein